ncbi:MAG: uroporphyrinogen-III synthase [Planctomycetota bacterium]
MTVRLDGRHVLVTRPGDAGRELSVMIAAAGGEARWAPALEFVPGADLGEAASALVSADYALVSSPRALAALGEAGPIPRRVQLLVVGRTTAREARRAGFDVVLEDDNGLRALVLRAAGRLPLSDRAVVWLRGNLSDPDALEPLVAAGARVRDLEVYATGDLYARTGLDTALLEGLDAVVLASPSAARALADALVRLGRAELLSVIVFAAIGETTAAALRELGASRVVTAGEPSNRGLLAALAGEGRGPELSPR